VSNNFYTRKFKQYTLHDNVML